MSIYTVHVTYTNGLEPKKDKYLMAGDHADDAIASVKQLWSAIKYYYYPHAENIKYTAKHIMSLPARIEP